MHSKFYLYLRSVTISLLYYPQGYDICFSLAANRLILAEHGRLGPQLRIRLNVSQDDVLFALDSRNNSG